MQHIHKLTFVNTMIRTRIVYLPLLVYHKPKYSCQVGFAMESKQTA